MFFQNKRKIVVVFHIFLFLQKLYYQSYNIHTCSQKKVQTRRKPWQNRAWGVALASINTGDGSPNDSGFGNRYGDMHQQQRSTAHLVPAENTFSQDFNSQCHELVMLTHTSTDRQLLLLIN
jgi:hypothetical protein